MVFHFKNIFTVGASLPRYNAVFLDECNAHCSVSFSDFLTLNLKVLRSFETSEHTRQTTYFFFFIFVYLYFLCVVFVFS
jgi:hypothetical protein